MNLINHKRHFQKIILVVLLLCTVGCNDKDEKGQFLEKGVELFDQGEFKQAELEIKNAIQENPDTAEAYYYMALLNEKGRKFKAMRENLIESVKLNPDNIKVRLKLGKVYLLFNQLDLSLKEVESVLTKDSEQFDALTLKAAILAKQNKEIDALAIIDDVLQKKADHIEAISLKTALLIKKKSFDEALSTLNPAIEKFEKNISLHLLKIQIDSKRNDVDAVISGYKKIIELKPDNIRIKYSLAKVYLNVNKRQEAEELLRTLVEKNPDLVEVKLKLLDFLYTVDEGEALKQLDVFVEKNKNDHSEVMIFSKFLIGKKNINKARELLNSVISDADVSDADSEAAQIILSRLDINDKNYKSGLKYIEAILKKNPNHLGAKFLKAEVLISDKNYADASQILEKILWQKPNMDQALSLLGKINIINGDIDKAHINFKDALKINPGNMPALNFMVARAMDEGHTDYALKLLKKASQLVPGQLVILDKLVKLNIAEKNWDDANKYINRIQQKKKGRLLAHYLRGKLLQKQNKFEEAIRVYKDVLKYAPRINDALVAMTACYQELNQQAQLLEFLDVFIDKHPDVFSGFLQKSRLLSSDKHYSEAIELLNAAVNNKGINNMPLYIELARLYGLLDKNEEEFSAYSKGLKVNSQDTNLLMLMAAYYEKNNEFEKAIKQYEKILLINPHNKEAKNNFASILLDHYGETKDVEKAVQLSESFKQLKQPYFLDTYGWAQFKQGNKELALSIFEEVIILAPEVPVFRYHLAVAYYEMSDTMAAASELRQAIRNGKGKEFPEKVLIEKLLAQIKNK